MKFNPSYEQTSTEEEVEDFKTLKKIAAHEKGELSVAMRELKDAAIEFRNVAFNTVEDESPAANDRQKNRQEILIKKIKKLKEVLDDRGLTVPQLEKISYDVNNPKARLAANELMAKEYSGSDEDRETR